MLSHTPHRREFASRMKRRTTGPAGSCHSGVLTRATVPQRAAASQRTLVRESAVMLAEGTPAPEFTLPDQDGNPVSLSDLRGSWVVLWWYPKAATAG